MTSQHTSQDMSRHLVKGEDGIRECVAAVGLQNSWGKVVSLSLSLSLPICFSRNFCHLFVILYIYDVLILLEHIFPNTYQGIINALYPAPDGFWLL